MAIDPKKYTRAELAKMVEDTLKAQNDAEIAAAEWLAKSEEMEGKIGELKAQALVLKQKIIVLTESIDQMNGEAINRENEIANLKADADALRNKLADTEAALGRANAEVAELKAGRAQQTKEIFEWQGSAQALHDDLLNARDRANYAEAHPWRNLWAWVKREAARHE